MRDPLSRIDLNLLVSLQILIQEKSVTRAAQRLFITQPAMSKTLNRLRILLDDDVFIRSSHGLIPTPKTVELEEPLNKILEKLTGLVVEHKDFIPKDTSATISIATSGTSASVGLSHFIQKLSIESPHILTLGQNLDQQYQQRLQSGDLDFALVAKKHTQEELIAHKLMDIHPILYMRKGHPLAKKTHISLEQRRQYQHIALYFPNFESTKKEIQKLFASFGISSNVPFLSTNLLVCMEMLINSDMLMIASDRLSDSQIVKANFVAKPIDDSINLRIDSLYLLQHVRSKNSAIHQYITKLIIESFNALPVLT